MTRLPGQAAPSGAGIRDRAGILRVKRGPARRPEARECGAELGQVQAIVLDPGGENVQAREAAGARVRDHGREAGRGGRRQHVEACRPPFPEGRERARPVVLEIATLDRPALGVDRREALAASQRDAEARAEVLGLLVAEMADDLDGRPLGGGRARPPGRQVQIVQQGVEHHRKAPELDPSVRQDVAGLVHGLTPPSPALYSDRSITPSRRRGYSHLTRALSRRSRPTGRCATASFSPPVAPGRSRARAIARSPTPNATRAFNAPGLVRWNLEKSYPTELAARGAPVPASAIVEADAAHVADALARMALAETRRERASASPRRSSAGCARLDSQWPPDRLSLQRSISPEGCDGDDVAREGRGSRACDEPGARPDRREVGDLHFG